MDMVAPRNLRTEYSEEPLGLDTRRPRFSWQLTEGEQEFFRIQLWEKGRPNILWDSGRVASGQSLWVPYGGPRLSERRPYAWRVRVWSEGGGPSDWSREAAFFTGPFGKDHWNGRWISYALDPPREERCYLPPINQEFKTNPHAIRPNRDQAWVVIFAKTFVLGDLPIDGQVCVTGLGYYELFVNGQKVGDQVLDPAFSDFSRRVYFSAYAWKDCFRIGENRVSLLLGSGFYNTPTQDLFQFNRAPWVAPEKALLDGVLSFADGTTTALVTDETWRWRRSSIVFNCVRAGETLEISSGSDGSLGDESTNSWSPVIIAESPAEKLTFQDFPPIRETERLAPKAVSQPQQGIAVVDFGRNVVGTVRARVHGKPGGSVTFDFNEALCEDGTVDTDHSSGHTYGRFQHGELRLGDSGAGTFRERFSYHGFRYLQISGLEKPVLSKDLEAISLHSDLKRTGQLRCSNKRVNDYVQAAEQTLLNSCHSLPGEEPTREKMGWTQDGQNTFWAYAYSFEGSAAIFRKYLRDHVDSQEPNGHVPPIVPTSGWGLIPPGASHHPWNDVWWGGTLIVTGWDHYVFTGDRDLLEELYPAMQRFADYLFSTSKEGLLFWGLGDWNEADLVGRGGRPARTPVEQTVSAGYYHVTRLMEAISEELGRDREQQLFQKRAEKTREAFNREFLDTKTGLYAHDSQTSQVLPLFTGLVPERSRSLVHERLLENIHKRNDHTSTGFVGVLPLMNYLVDSGEVDLAWRLFTQEDSPGWLHMLGAGTVGENLNAEGYGTGHHPFGGHILGWLYRKIAGIEPDFRNPKNPKLRVQPRYPKGLDRLDVKVMLPNGPVELEWHRDGVAIRQELKVPGNLKVR